MRDLNVMVPKLFADVLLEEVQKGKRACLQILQGMTNAGIICQAFQGSHSICAQFQGCETLPGTFAATITEDIQQDFQSICHANSLSGLCISVYQSFEPPLQHNKAVEATQGADFQGPSF